MKKWSEYDDIQCECIVTHGYFDTVFVILPSNTRCLQMNGAVSKVNKKFISHLTWAKRTPSAAATV